MTTQAPDAPRLVPVSLIADTMNWMARAYERIHGLPRISDTDLADKVGAAKERLRPYLDAPAVQPAAGREGIADHDCLAKRRPGEPMFILLGRDPDAHNIVRLWAERRLAAGGDPEHCQMGLDTAERMAAYAADPANRPASAPDASDYPAISTPAQASGEPFMYAYENVDKPGDWRAYRHQLKRADESICPGLALYAHPPAQASETGGERQTYKVTWVDDAKNPNDRRMYLDGQQWAKVYGWDKASLDARCAILEAALSAPQAAPGVADERAGR